MTLPRFSLFSLGQESLELINYDSSIAVGSELETRYMNNFAVFIMACPNINHIMLIPEAQQF